jgi:hypothetical protein
MGTEVQVTSARVVRRDKDGYLYEGGISQVVAELGLSRAAIFTAIDTGAPLHGSTWSWGEHDPYRQPSGRYEVPERVAAPSESPAEYSTLTIGGASITIGCSDAPASTPVQKNFAATVVDDLDEVDDVDGGAAVDHPAAVASPAHPGTPQAAERRTGRGVRRELDGHIFATVREAATETGRAYQSIYNACINGRRCGESTWSWADQPARLAPGQQRPSMRGKHRQRSPVAPNAYQPPFPVRIPPKPQAPATVAPAAPVHIPPEAKFSFDGAKAARNDGMPQIGGTYLPVDADEVFGKPLVVISSGTSAPPADDALPLVCRAMMAIGRGGQLLDPTELERVIAMVRDAADAQRLLGLIASGRPMRLEAGRLVEVPGTAPAFRDGEPGTTALDRAARAAARGFASAETEANA